MLRLEVLPARYGDCLLIEYGDEQALRRILIDGGAQGVYKKSLKPRLEKISNLQRIFELLVVTHVDYDHIRGIIELTQDDEISFQAKDIWFNGWRHLKARDTLAGKHGEELTDLILENATLWNDAFGYSGQQAVKIPDQGTLPEIELAGGLKVTLLAPTQKLLSDLIKDWEKSCKSVNLSAEDLEEERTQRRRLLEALDVDRLADSEFDEDQSTANGSSIAFALEYKGIRLLLTGDAHPTSLAQAIERLPEKERYFDACKIPHHGSRGSTNKQLIKAMDCDTYIFSSNGDQFQHPHKEAVARVIKASARNANLKFNYRSDETEIWDVESLKSQHNYTTQYPDDPKEGLVLKWEDKI